MDRSLWDVTLRISCKSHNQNINLFGNVSCFLKGWKHIQWWQTSSCVDDGYSKSQNWCKCHTSPFFYIGISLAHFNEDKTFHDTSNGQTSPFRAHDYRWPTAFVWFLFCLPGCLSCFILKWAQKHLNKKYSMSVRILNFVFDTWNCI